MWLGASGYLNEPLTKHRPPAQSPPQEHPAPVDSTHPPRPHRRKLVSSSSVRDVEARLGPQLQQPAQPRPTAGARPGRPDASQRCVSWRRQQDERRSARQVGLLHMSHQEKGMISRASALHHPRSTAHRRRRNATKNQMQRATVRPVSVCDCSASASVQRDLTGCGCVSSNSLYALPIADDDDARCYPQEGQAVPELRERIKNFLAEQGMIKGHSSANRRNSTGGSQPPTPSSAGPAPPTSANPQSAAVAASSTNNATSGASTAAQGAVLPPSPNTNANGAIAPHSPTAFADPGLTSTPPPSVPSASSSYLVPGSGGHPSYAPAGSSNTGYSPASAQPALPHSHAQHPQQSVLLLSNQQQQQHATNQHQQHRQVHRQPQYPGGGVGMHGGNLSLRPGERAGSGSPPGGVMNCTYWYPLSSGESPLEAND